MVHLDTMLRIIVVGGLATGSRSIEIGMAGAMKAD